MLGPVITLLFFSASVYGAGQFSIYQHPESIVLKGHDHLKESLLKEVLSVALGFSAEQYSSWKGLYIEDPFNLAEAVVTVSIEGVDFISQSKGHHFPLKTDVDNDEIFDSLESRIKERYPGGDSDLVHVDLGQGLIDLQNYELFKGIKEDKPKKSHTILKNSIDEDREILSEINLLNAISVKIENGGSRRNYVPDVFWFKVSGLHALVDLHGANSSAVKEAKRLLNEAIWRLNDAFKKAYDGSVLVSVITSDVVHTRRARNILADPVPPPKPDINYNRAKDYHRDFPVIFNIILWLCLALGFSLLATALFIGNMDPGRDSIIYRMTSTRMKKDN